MVCKILRFVAESVKAYLRPGPHLVQPLERRMRSAGAPVLAEGRLPTERDPARDPILVLGSPIPRGCLCSETRDDRRKRAWDRDLNTVGHIRPFEDAIGSAAVRMIFFHLCKMGMTGWEYKQRSARRRGKPARACPDRARDPDAQSVTQQIKRLPKPPHLTRADENRFADA